MVLEAFARHLPRGSIDDLVYCEKGFAETGTKNEIEERIMFMMVEKGG